MTNARLEELLSGALAGQVVDVAELGAYRAPDLYAVANKQRLVLRPAVVIRVLEAFAEGAHSDEQVQAWASFMRRGYVAGARGPIHPLDIEYDPVSEIAIADAISRMDELGDLIDGKIDADEISQLIEALSPPAQ